MTVADVSAGNQDAICSFQESLEQKAVIHPAGTHESDQPDIGRILHSGHPCQVSPGVGAPVADESQNIWFIIRRHMPLYYDLFRKNLDLLNANLAR